jgi:hypothetical protein
VVCGAVRVTKWIGNAERLDFICSVLVGKDGFNMFNYVLSLLDLNRNVCRPRYIGEKKCCFNGAATVPRVRTLSIIG